MRPAAANVCGAFSAGAKPTILVIDSLERLGSSRDGARSRKVLRQLADLFSRSQLEGANKIVSQEPNGSEADYTFDYKYHPDEFQYAGAVEFAVRLATHEPRR